MDAARGQGARGQGAPGHAVPPPLEAVGHDHHEARPRPGRDLVRAGMHAALRPRPLWAARRRRGPSQPRPPCSVTSPTFPAAASSSGGYGERPTGRWTAGVETAPTRRGTTFLPVRFRPSTAAAIAGIAVRWTPMAQPHAGAVTTTGRRRPRSSFPHVVFFGRRSDSIEVVAVSHARRRPGYWLGRRSWSTTYCGRPRISSRRSWTRTSLK